MSLRRVMRDGAPDTMHIQSTTYRGRTLPPVSRRVLEPVNSPLLDPEGALVGIVHHVEDVTAVHRELRRIRRAYERTETPTAHDAEAQSLFVRYLAHADEERGPAGTPEKRGRSAAPGAHVARGHRPGHRDRPGRAPVRPGRRIQILVGISQRTNVKLRESRPHSCTTRTAGDSAPLLADDVVTSPPGPPARGPGPRGRRNLSHAGSPPCRCGIRARSRSHGRSAAAPRPVRRFPLPERHEGSCGPPSSPEGRPPATRALPSGSASVTPPPPGVPEFPATGFVDRLPPPAAVRHMGADGERP
ncbi:hypothetical protein GCM10023238_32590 [Streptomyces heliomycini]